MRVRDGGRAGGVSSALGSGTAVDYAEVIRDLVDVHYPYAEKSC
jgi:hypothetical protein